MQPKVPSPRKAWVNIKNPAFYVSPIKFGKPSHLETSTPTRSCGGPLPTALADISQIDRVGSKESASNVLKSQVQMQTRANKPKSIQPPISTNPLQQPLFVALRRRPRPDHGKQLHFSTEGKQSEDNIGVTDSKELSVISIAHSLDMSNIIDNRVEEESAFVIQDSFKVSAINDDSILNLSDSHIQNQVADVNSKISDSVSLQASPKKSRITKSTANLSPIWIDQTQPIEVNTEVETISVSSTSTSTSTATTLSTTSASITTTSVTTANQPKESIRPKVGFDASNSIHELSMVSQRNEPSQKIVIKGGKWRRTVYEMRKNKITQCRSTILFTEQQTF